MIKSILGTLLTTGATLFGFGQIQARPRSKDIKTIADVHQSQQAVPLLSGSKIYGGLVYISGKGYHEKGDITKATTGVLDKIEEELIKADTNMERALKVNVFLANGDDFDAMNDAYRGRFGNNPPVRTCVVTGLPNLGLVQIDCIAALKNDI